MSRAQALLLGTLTMIWVVGCATRGAQRPWRGETIPVPDEAHAYSTDARPENVGENGRSALEIEITAELAKRGYQAVADGALTATARWVLSEANQRRQLGPLSADAASRHFGYPGVILGIAAFNSEDAKFWLEVLDGIPKNMPLNRIGVYTSPAGRSCAVIFGSVALSMQPIARFLEPGETVNLRGEVDKQFDFSHVYLTKPDGTVEERQLASRKLEYSAKLTTAGRYKLEVMGDGPTGPIVVANVPLFVGILEPSLSEQVGRSASPAEAEARMLELLNQTRIAAKLQAVQSDSEIRKVALGHSKDMADHAFFSHVSPSAGTTRDRVVRSGMLVSDCGENLSQAPTPETAHQGLMDSPGHRAVMLGATFTHVGIAAVESGSGLVVTMLLCRRPDPAKLPRDATQVEAAILAIRAAKGLTRPAVDPIYRAAAQRGVQAYLKAASPNPEIAAKATSEAIQSEVNRLRAASPNACTLIMELMEMEKLERTPILVAPGLAKFGLGAQMINDDKGARLVTVMVLEGVPCR